jgi:hypothetical protein
LFYLLAGRKIKKRSRVLFLRVGTQLMAAACWYVQVLLVLLRENLEFIDGNGITTTRAQLPVLIRDYSKITIAVAAATVLRSAANWQ